MEVASGEGTQLTMPVLDEPTAATAAVQVSAHALSGERLCQVVVAQTAAGDELRTTIARALPQGLLNTDVVVFDGMPLDHHVRPFAATSETDVWVTVVFSKTFSYGDWLYYSGPSMHKRTPDGKLVTLGTGARCKLVSDVTSEVLVEAKDEKWRVCTGHLARHGESPGDVAGGFACSESVYYLGPPLILHCSQCAKRNLMAPLDRGSWCLQPGCCVEVLAAGVLADSVQVKLPFVCTTHGEMEAAVCLNFQKLSREPPKRRGFLHRCFG